jgi:hypothetical protein
MGGYYQKGKGISLVASYAMFFNKQRLFPYTELFMYQMPSGTRTVEQ